MGGIRELMGPGGGVIQTEEKNIMPLQTWVNKRARGTDTYVDTVRSNSGGELVRESLSIGCNLKRKNLSYLAEGDQKSGLR